MSQAVVINKEKEQKLAQQVVQISQKPKNHNKIEAHRPSNLAVSKIFSDNQKWRQCKIIGKNISIRSYSASCAFKNQQLKFKCRFYIYGGYQILNGSLKDFYSLNLDDNQDKFVWKQIKPKSNVNPGARSKHSLISGKQKIYLIGGLYQDIHSSNDIYEWNPKEEIWTKLMPQGIQQLPKIDSFGCILIEKEGIQKIYIVADIMHSRCGHAVATDNQNIYIFGGDGQIPAVRNGHTMNFFNNRLYVFGGIHDITWQLDDLHIYNLNRNSWTTLQQDSPRKIQKKIGSQENIQQKSIQKKSNKKKNNWYQTMGSNLNPIKSGSISPMNQTALKKNYSTSYNNNMSQQQNQSPGKMIDQQRKKVFYQKKAQMLKNFQIQESQKSKYILLQTSSQAMKNSLDIIGNLSQNNSPVKNNGDKLTEFGKASHSKFLAPLQNNTNLIIGKKPCARDGHCSVMLNDQLIIFGGDRHQMSFNDIYKLNFSLAQKQIKNQ